MADFVDHLQLVPVPSRGGKRAPDGDHRPGGLGTRTLADRLEALGWTARLEDMAYEKPVSERRLAEAYARGIGDAVLSAWDRSRFPIVLSLVSYGSLGIVDALGPEIGLLWVAPPGAYRARGILRRPALEATTLAMITGRAKRDAFAVAPVRLTGERILVVGGQRVEDGQARALAADGIRVVDPASLAAAVAAVGADTWVLHLDAGALPRQRVPAADGAGPEGIEPEFLADSIATAIEGRSLRAIAIARYDLNRDPSGATADTLTQLLDRLLIAAGGQPRPAARGGAARGASS